MYFGIFDDLTAVGIDDPGVPESDNKVKAGRSCLEHHTTVDFAEHTNMSMYFARLDGVVLVDEFNHMKKTRQDWIGLNRNVRLFSLICFRLSSNSSIRLLPVGTDGATMPTPPIHTCIAYHRDFAVFQNAEVVFSKLFQGMSTICTQVHKHYCTKLARAT
jgi:hypothetical protein